MPIYEYVCTDCTHEFEAIQKMSDDPLVFCPECSNETLKKKISAAAFKLKGTGWYETDFKNPKGKDNGKGNDKGSEKGSGDKSSKANGDSAKSDGKASSSDKPKASKPSKEASAA